MLVACSAEGIGTRKVKTKLFCILATHNIIMAETMKSSIIIATVIFVIKISIIAVDITTIILGREVALS